jgi:ABC-type lipoprotein release transport system permease subunit
MNLWRLVKRSLSFYWRTNLGVVLAVVVSTAVLTGALVVGDSVRYSLMKMVDARLGDTQLALVSQNRFFTTDLADELSAELDATVVPVLRLRGQIATSDDKRLANNIQILGVDERFFEIGAEENAETFWSDWSSGVALNQPLATRLGAKTGDEVKLRIEKPGMMPREVPLTPDSDLSVLFRPTVKAVAGRRQFGRFDLQANQISPLNAFVSLKWLEKNMDHVGHANMLLAASEDAGLTVERADAAIKNQWQLADAGLEIRRLDKQNAYEIRSNRIFIDRFISDAALDGATGILTYFVNELRVGDKATPYSTVAALTSRNDGKSLIPSDMKDDEILINQWLADDLEAEEGDSIELAYYVVGPMRKLVEKTRSFTVRAILPMSGAAVDPELMPDFPGLADADNCRDWEPGIDIDLDRIRQKDEVYWDDYRGTPKAFVTLAAGRDMWANRYGNLTAIRYAADDTSAEKIEQKLLAAVDPASVGLFFRPVRELGTRAGAEGSYFGWLFLGLSFFLIAAAIVLTGLLFVFGVESRSEQVGMLMAVGFLPKQVRRLLLAEGAAVAVLGAIGGTVAALLYTKIMIYVLSEFTIGAPVYFHAKAFTLIAGALTAVVISMIAIWLTLRKQVSRPARELLAGVAQWQFITAKAVSRGRVGIAVAAAAIIGALALPAGVGDGDSEAVAGAFFGAGALLLTAGLILSNLMLKMVAGRWKRPMKSLGGLGLRNCSRRSGRSLAVVALLACGVFLLIAVEVFRRDPLASAERNGSGTGGFTLFGECSIGILHDLNTESGRDSLVVDDDALEGVEVLQLRVRDGDDASCFNLNRAQRPRLLGVQPERLDNRGSFSFASDDAAWTSLNQELDDGVVPAIGDYPTIKWALGKSLGDQIRYTDENGQEFRVRLVAMLENSILQGSLIISEEQFVEHFPSEAGYRMLLIDTPEDKVDKVADHLSARLRSFGLELTTAKRRLQAFSEVENTYLSIFQILGGLGLVLGSVGVGLVVLRNMLERRNELAMLRAVGFNNQTLRHLVFYEHYGLMLGGLACGLVAALVAAGPSLRTLGAAVPYVSLALTVVFIALSGLVWVWLATEFALSGEMLDALRSE